MPPKIATVPKRIIAASNGKSFLKNPPPDPFETVVSEDSVSG
ncbi:hypothetical protein O0H45_03330 [Staphylococcus pseudintermedius]|nr:hypothetical protein [Staphylococcus pseudintermedius]MDE9963107.1 hypothetical protein [Staphylococcus pseudintermedius]MDE9974497.1 hypothetical protein [Staphylococcus pseudintermedius]MDE9976723.1 hypothetical protein [Staphylococcus pseudintermedius]MDE9995913.1 hypothetical protein [Staphylococcus pseudintermedius]MDF0052194.1 hypothetical protein [Staphylococcus pseudintermedius]